MSESSPTIEPEALLAHAGWLRALVRGLVLDDGAADDVLQETWLAALSRPPRRRRSLGAWLATVARNAARQRGRSEGARADRERRVAAERAPAGRDELVSRVALHRRVTGLVLDLDEPYRSTLLLRYFEDLTPAAIARKHGIPEGTVRSRLKRGLDRLRERLDAEHDGDRRAWCFALLPLARGPAGGGAAPWLAAVSAGKLAAALLLLAAGAAGLAAFLSLGDPGEPPAARPRETAPPDLVTAVIDDPAPAEEKADLVRIRGRVADGRGRPVGGVRVTAWPDETTAPGGGAPSLAIFLEAARQPAEAVASAVTGGEGAFVLGTDAGQRLVLRAAGRGLASPAIRGLDLGRGADGVPITVYPAGRVTGTVRDEDGEPIAGATVTLLTIPQPGYRAETRPDGTFAIDAVMPGEYGVLAEHPRYPDTFVRRMLAPVDDLRLHLAPGRAVEGRVVAADGETPVSGARVMVSADSGSLAAGGPLVTGPPVVVETGEDGRFRAARVPALSSIDVLADAAEQGWGRAIGSGRDGPIEVRLYPVREILGRAVEKKDGALVGVPGLALSLRETAAPPLREARTVTTDADGGFRGRVACGTRILVAADPRHPMWTARSQRLEAAASECLVLVSRKATIAGRVLDVDGRPAPGVLVGIAGNDATNPAGAAGRGVSDGRGRFLLRGVVSAAEDIRVYARDPGGALAISLPFRGAAGESVEGVEVRFAPQPGLEGRIVDERGEPVSSVSVIVLRNGIRSVGAFVRLAQSPTTYTDRQGRFRFTGVHREARVLSAERSGYRDLRVTVPEHAVHTGRIEDLVLTAACRLRGRVTDRDGRPVSGAVVSAGNTRVFGGGRCYTDVTGRFSIDGIGAGTATLSAGATGFRAIEGISVELPTEREVEWVLHRVEEDPDAGAIGGVLLDADGHPASGGVLARRAKETYRYSGSAIADPRGRFLIRGLERGRYRIEVQGSPLHASVEDVETGTLDLLLRAKPGLAIAGVLLGPGGKPLPGVRVGVHGAGGTMSGIDGRFRIRGLAAGSYTVIAGDRRHTAPAMPGVPAGTDGLVLRLSRARSISGTVLDADGSAPRPGHVRVRSEGDDPREWVVPTRPDGSFRVEGLPEGRCRVTARGPGSGENGSTTVEAGARSVRIQLERREE